MREDGTSDGMEGRFDDEMLDDGTGIDEDKLDEVSKMLLKEETEFHDFVTGGREGLFDFDCTSCGFLVSGTTIRAPLEPFDTVLITFDTRVECSR